jgi:hypothetical protein
MLVINKNYTKMRRQQNIKLSSSVSTDKLATEMTVNLNMIAR